MQQDVTIVILAAGLGTRMRSQMAKVLHRAGGLALVEHVVRTAGTAAEAERTIVVTGHQAERVEALLAPSGVRFARQTEQKGTGHALMMTRGETKPEGLLVVLYGDCPLLSPTTLDRLLRVHRAGTAAATVVTVELDDPTGYGRIILDADGSLFSIVEQKAATPEQLAVKEINSGIYCFDAALLWKHIDEIRPDNPAREYYLTDIVHILRHHGHRVATMRLADANEILGINTRVELAQADRILRERKVTEVMLAGATVEKPDTVTIDVDVSVGQDTVIEAFAQLRGATTVGSGCRIGAGTILEDAAVGDGVELLPYTVIQGCRLDDGAHVGPFARLRMGAHVEAGAHIGNFVELKKTRLGAGSKAMHLAYLGDSEIGRKVNVGAGTITCNYDGSRKHATRIGDGVFVGSNSTLVAPLELADGAYVAAGSVITEAVPGDALALGRSRQVIKEGWAKKRRNS